MRVLSINDEPEAGGAAAIFRRTNRLLRQAGHDVIEVTGDSLPPSQLPAEIRLVHDPRLIAHLSRILDGAQADVAHVQNVHGRLSTQVLPFLKRRGVPIVYQVNDYFFFCNSYVAYNRRLDAPCKRCINGNMLWAVRYGCVNNLGVGRLGRALLQAGTRLALRWLNPWQHVDLFLVTGEETAVLLEEWGVGRARQRRILNPMVSEEFAGAKALGDEVVFYGACLPNKGSETFLAALEHVDPACRLGVYLTGMSPDYEARLRAVAERRGLRVRADSTLRWQHGLRERVAESRAVVVPSQWWVTSESVVYEGMLMGKPVIVSRAGGNAELVDHGETGFLFEPRDAKALARYMTLLSTDQTLASRMGAAAGARSRTRFAEDLFVRSLEGAYQEAMRCASAS